MKMDTYRRQNALEYRLCAARLPLTTQSYILTT